MLKMKKVLAVLTLASTVLPLVAMAQYDGPPTPLITSLTDVLSLIDRAGVWIFSIIMALAVIVILVGAFLFLTAGGDPEKIASARGWIIGGVIGVAIALLSSGLISMLKAFIGA